MNFQISQGSEDPEKMKELEEQRKTLEAEKEKLENERKENEKKMKEATESVQQISFQNQNKTQTQNYQSPPKDTNQNKKSEMSSITSNLDLRAETNITPDIDITPVPKEPVLDINQTDDENIKNLIVRKYFFYFLEES